MTFYVLFWSENLVIWQGFAFMRILWHRYKLCMVTFIISEACRTGVSFDERMLSSFSVKIIVAILIFPTVEGWVEEELSTKGVGKKKEMGGVEQ